VRAFNFSPGPAVLPLEVLEKAQAELLDWQGSGMSVMEISHRSKSFLEVAAQAEADLRELMSIPPHYKILFMQGGASAQFSLVPMNLSPAGSTVDFINTGHWSQRGINEAARYCSVHIAADAGGGYSRVPPQAELRFSGGASYAHYTPNETISGVEFDYVPETGGAPLVADMSSSILSRPIDVGKFGLIYAGAQKNIGPGGLTGFVVREDLPGPPPPATPHVFDYQAISDNQSMLNTPPTFSWYMAGLVFKWLRGMGGVAEAGKRNQAKAAMLYACIDGSRLYKNSLAADARSRMNVTFTLRNAGLDSEFLAAAAANGLKELKGHRLVGGMRASLYNAMPIEGVEKLCEFMRDFEHAHP
jgi:phosphoserine aminotransferase